MHFLADELRIDLTSQGTVIRKAVDLKKKIALFLYFIAHLTGIGSLGNLFGVSRAFSSICIREIADSIIKRMKFKYLRIERGDELLRILNSYNEKWGFPKCASAIDGTHIPISAPQKDHVAYVNSITMRALVDGNYLLGTLRWVGQEVCMMPVYSQTRSCITSDVTGGCFQQI